jgi:hypothetical protein
MSRRIHQINEILRQIHQISPNLPNKFDQILRQTLIHGHQKRRQSILS